MEGGADLSTSVEMTILRLLLKTPLAAVNVRTLQELRLR
jgi:hypothetical protein